MPPAPVSRHLASIPPYDWRAITDFLRRRAIAGVETIDAHGAYHRTIAPDGVPGTISIRPATAGLTATINHPIRAAHPAIIDRVRHIFDLDADPAAIAAHLGTDPMLAPVLAARPGLRVPGAWDGFELAVRAVLGQQITVVAASRLAARLVAAFGTPIETDLPGLTHLFPTPARLASADIASLGMPAARARTLNRLADAAQDPTLFTALDARQRLAALPGFGDWTVNYIAMRALRDPDAFPAADIGLLRATAGPGGRLTPSALLARAEAWRPWRAYAALHLWSKDAT